MLFFILSNVCHRLSNACHTLAIASALDDVRAFDDVKAFDALLFYIETTEIFVTHRMLFHDCFMITIQNTVRERRQLRSKIER